MVARMAASVWEFSFRMVEIPDIGHIPGNFVVGGVPNWPWKSGKSESRSILIPHPTS
jgi:hypothetical protein